MPEPAIEATWELLQQFHPASRDTSGTVLAASPAARAWPGPSTFPLGVCSEFPKAYQQSVTIAGAQSLNEMTLFQSAHAPVGEYPEQHSTVLLEGGADSERYVIEFYLDGEELAFPGVYRYQDRCDYEIDDQLGEALSRCPGGFDVGAQLGFSVLGDFEPVGARGGGLEAPEEVDRGSGVAEIEDIEVGLNEATLLDLSDGGDAEAREDLAALRSDANLRFRLRHPSALGRRRDFGGVDHR
jgi:hypothetical protein